MFATSILFKAPKLSERMITTVKKFESLTGLDASKPIYLDEEVTNHVSNLKWMKMRMKEININNMKILDASQFESAMKDAKEKENNSYYYR